MLFPFCLRRSVGKHWKKIRGEGKRQPASRILKLLFPIIKIQFTVVLTRKSRSCGFRF